MNHKVKSFYHDNTYTWTHLVICNKTNCAVLIDPVLDYNPNNANTSTEFIDKILFYISSKKLQLKNVMETHAHADHLSSAIYVNTKTGAKITIGSGIVGVQKTFKNIFNFGEDFRVDGSQFHQLVKNDDIINFGECQLKAMHTPGHTDDSMSYIVGNSVFIGDTLFSPDYGSARCDFPGGDAKQLFDSVQKIYALGKDRKLYLCHDYPPDSRQPQAWFSSSDQQDINKHINKNTSIQDFVLMRNARDAKLNHPVLIIPSIQVNIAAGQFPSAESNGQIYLKIPVNLI